MVLITGVRDDKQIMLHFLKAFKQSQWISKFLHVFLPYRPHINTADHFSLNIIQWNQTVFLRRANKRIAVKRLVNSNHFHSGFVPHLDFVDWTEIWWLWRLWHMIPVVFKLKVFQGLLQRSCYHSVLHTVDSVACLWWCLTEHDS